MGTNIVSFAAEGREAQSYAEKDFLPRTRRLTVEGGWVGEAYFAPDGIPERHVEHHCSAPPTTTRAPSKAELEFRASGRLSVLA